MTFTIDTGTPIDQGAIAFVSDWMRDLCPVGYSDAQTVQAYAHHIIGDMRRPAKLETVRDHLTFNWQFIRLLATEQPGLFDEIWTAYFERMHAQ